MMIPLRILLVFCALLCNHCGTQTGRYTGDSLITSGDSGGNLGGDSGENLTGGSEVNASGSAELTVSGRMVPPSE